MSVIEHLRNCRCSFHCSKSFWDSPLSECTLWPVNPRVGQKVAVLGFDPARRLSRAHQSQTDLEQGSSGHPERRFAYESDKKQPFEHKAGCLNRKKQLRS